MRAMLESTTDAILVTDEVKITDFNQKFIDIWKVPREILEEGVARKVRQLMSQNFAEPQHFLSSHRGNYRHRRGELRYLGTERWANGRASFASPYY